MNVKKLSFEKMGYRGLREKRKAHFKRKEPSKKFQRPGLNPIPSAALKKELGEKEFYKHHQRGTIYRGVERARPNSQRENSSPRRPAPWGLKRGCDGDSEGKECDPKREKEGNLDSLGHLKVENSK